MAITTTWAWAISTARASTEYDTMMMGTWMDIHTVSISTGGIGRT